MGSQISNATIQVKFTSHLSIDNLEKVRSVMTTGMKGEGGLKKVLGIRLTGNKGREEMKKGIIEVSLEAITF